jgi:hypothetical protein
MVHEIEPYSTCMSFAADKMLWMNTPKIHCLVGVRLLGPRKSAIALSFCGFYATLPVCASAGWRFFSWQIGRLSVFGH